MRSKANVLLLPLVAAVLVGMIAFAARAGDDKGNDKKDAKANSLAHRAFKAMRDLAGTWDTGEQQTDGSMNGVVFKVTAGGSAVVETMFPGAKHEMVNAYHLDGENMICTHYCAQGVQPRMKLVSFDDNTMKFEFMDGTNLKPGAGHMGGLELVIEGNKLTERWTYVKDGKPAGDPTVFEMTKKG